MYVYVNRESSWKESQLLTVGQWDGNRQGEAFIMEYYLSVLKLA